MKREEKLMNAANGYAFDLDCGDMNTNRDTFIAGAQWADSNPKEGLVEIQKVVEWIETNVVAYNPSKEKMECIVNINNMLEDFKINN